MRKDRVFPSPILEYVSLKSQGRSGVFLPDLEPSGGGQGNLDPASRAVWNSTGGKQKLGKIVKGVNRGAILPNFKVEVRSRGSTSQTNPTYYLARGDGLALTDIKP